MSRSGSEFSSSDRSTDDEIQNDVLRVKLWFSGDAQSSQIVRDSASRASTASTNNEEDAPTSSAIVSPPLVTKNEDASSVGLALPPSIDEEDTPTMTLASSSTVRPPNHSPLFLQRNLQMSRAASAPDLLQLNTGRKFK